MALSGTLETFSLPEVLRLLSSTKKTGLLALDGDRGRGRIWVRDGAIVAADADRAVNEELEGVAFELLRFAAAGFEFESGADAPVDAESHDVEAVLAEAESRLAEWREIESVVPSLDVWVRMVAEVDDERPVTPTQWRVLAQVGTGTSGHDLAERLGQGEYDICRRLRDLIGDGMVELDVAPLAATPTVGSSPALGVDVDVDVDRNSTVEPSFVEPALDPDAVSSLGADLASFVAVGTAPEPIAIDFADRDDEAEPATTFEAMVDTGELDPQPEHDAFDPAAEPERAAEAAADVQADDGDFLSQLSQLSPRAAAAVEATWSDEAAPAAGAPDAPVEASPTADPAPAGDDVDQNLLLRFLSSAKG